MYSLPGLLAQPQLMEDTLALWSWIHLLETMNVVSSEEAVDVNRVFTTGSHSACVLLALADHGPLQQAGALQGQLQRVHPASSLQSDGKQTQIKQSNMATC